MPRPTFRPDPEQAVTIRELQRHAARIVESQDRRDELIAKAAKQGIPIEQIAKAAGVTVKTVYNRLARLEAQG